MLYVIYCQDDLEKPNERDKYYDDHRAYLEETSAKIVIAGPFLNADGKTRIGSMLVVEASSKEEAVKFQQNDPFARNKVWKHVSINPYVMAIDGR
ncbi:YciI-like protein [compost metagenome]